MSIVARHYGALADADDVEMAALTLQIQAIRRRRDAWRDLERFFTPPDIPLPPIMPPMPDDPDYTDPKGQP